ncbi:exodeoxyribonuclease VII large subunit [Xanthobacter sp. KR7-225]|uniref:exodeoxyribonuclease VII large subunit n=1 Tax=Xanthobacter sp. KR7-225 TaxID=3156613 RepID=UPI0032B37CBF
MAETEDTRVNAPEWSVSELSAALRRTVEDAYGHVRVRGEISGYRGPHSSGHAYFALKDQGAKLDAVIWKGTFARLRLKPEEGLEVVATGRLTTYPGKSGYQIVIEALEFAGAGAIMVMLEERRLRLAAEGLFDPARKKKLPYLPRVIGVVTSPTGAVIRDILHRLADRFPRDVVVWPVRVQGETSAAEVAAAIRGFNALPEGGTVPRPDVIVVARGGGSLEDLLGFSEEVVVRAAAESAIPLVSAVGHETDVTLIDFAADLRAPTPTAAAELVVPVRSDLIALVEGFGARLAAAPVRLQERRRADLRALARLLPTAASLMEAPRQRLDGAADRLPRALAANAVAHRVRLAAARLSPQTLRIRMARSGERFAAQAARFEAAGRAQRLAFGAGRRALGDLGRRAGRAVDEVLRAERRRLASLAQLLEALSYHGVLKRGFALVRDAQGQAVRAAAAVAPGAGLEIEFADGRVAVRAGAGEGPPPPREGAVRRPRRGSAKQGAAGADAPTLFDP